jgi:hypothetical protein
MPTDVNVDLSAINAEAEKIQEQELNTEEELSTGHKVLFYVFLGALCLLGVGVPVLIFLLVKKSKECNRLKAEKKEAALAETNAAEGSEEAKGEEPKAETKPEPEKEDKKKK